MSCDRMCSLVQCRATGQREAEIDQVWWKLSKLLEHKIVAQDVEENG